MLVSTRWWPGGHWQYAMNYDVYRISYDTSIIVFGADKPLPKEHKHYWPNK